MSAEIFNVYKIINVNLTMNILVKLQLYETNIRNIPICERLARHTIPSWLKFYSILLFK